LALLLLGSYRRLVDTVVAELESRGYQDVRASHDYAMRAIQRGANSASELGRRLSVSKQAAAQTIEVLLERGYVCREQDPGDARRKRIQVTARGAQLLHDGELIFDDLYRRLARQLGRKELALLEEQLATIVGDEPIRLEAPGWVAQDPH
jgi:DNA-binding MarR family transcriptional regulator